MKEDQIFNIQSKQEFEKLAVEIFKFQALSCKVYKDFLGFLNFDVNSVSRIAEIPFLPIQFFKSHKVVSNANPVEQVFLSSGTTGNQSQHFITDLNLYEKSYNLGFKQFYGNIEEYTVLALLPSYLEREGSSLIYMVADLIQKSNTTLTHIQLLSV